MFAHYDFCEMFSMGQSWRLSSLDSEQSLILGELCEGIWQDYVEVLAALVDPGILLLDTVQLRKWIRLTTHE